ncbi:tetratricopeptide repeat protein [Caulobacter sp. NIBR1757]|uniref:tetratricopeptide repeat protein n=1 Tax=Caulobacter sp. NIBR1757 TaxID=3016000 RepID=UPI0022F0A95D|nr:tetratricopeptide repeat protein [Caulobacter sp. NIBR1757]WGM37335.1 hypothetical protein AMEJIAPC_00232 [Caulobacter sp. NIBR1757]
MRGFAGLVLVAALVAAPVMAAEKTAPGEDMMMQASKLAETDQVTALALMRKAAATGDAEAINGLAGFLWMGVGAPADTVEATALYEQAIAKGSKVAASNLGRRLLLDDDEANDARAIAMLKPLAQDEVLASTVLYPIGRAMLFGQGGTNPFLKGGMDLLEMAENREPNNADLFYLLARGYQAGWGERKRDAARSAKYFRHAAELGDERAQWYYGMALLNGDGVRMDAPEAWTWVRKSGEGGYIEGQISTAVMLAVGQGVREDDAQARDWYRKAAERGSAHALRGLGLMMMTGEGGPVDAVTGQAYAEMAREGGDKNAGVLLEQMGKDLSVEDRRKAEEIKIAWKRKYGDPR